jgi:tetratricopeptide (TPR) repeat protein
MVKIQKFFALTLVLIILAACASRMKDQMKLYRSAYSAGKYEEAEKILDTGVLKKEDKSRLLWLLEKGTVQLARQNVDGSIQSFQESLELIDRLFTKRLSAKAASLLVNDASDEFYGASYERSYAHYYLARAYYARYLQSQAPLDLQSARATILAWDSYFQELQRSATHKTLYQTDLMLKVFGGQIHELSGIRGDKQISLQLYKDALKILEVDAGIFPVFNSKSSAYLKLYVEAVKKGQGPPQKMYERTAAYEDLQDFLQLKILALTREIRGSDFQALMKSLAPSEKVKQKLAGTGSRVVVVLEEGLIPAKVGKPFNFGIRGAMDSVDNPAAKAFIASVGVAAVSLFAMNQLKMMPSAGASPGSFLFAYDMTRLAVSEAAVSFELPMIEKSQSVERMELFILNDKGEIIQRAPLPVVSENGDIARVVLEEDVVARYVRTGSRVAVKHILAIVAAMKVYRMSQGKGDLLAHAAAMATYVASSKGIAAMEKADTRHWTTLPQALRMTELSLPPGNYQLALAPYKAGSPPEAPGKTLGSIQVRQSDNPLHFFKFARTL